MLPEQSRIVISHTACKLVSCKECFQICIFFWCNLYVVKQLRRPSIDLLKAKYYQNSIGTESARGKDCVFLVSNNFFWKCILL